MHRDERTCPYYLVNFPTGIDRFHHYESVEQAQRGAEVDLRRMATNLLGQLDGKEQRMTKDRLYKTALQEAPDHTEAAERVENP